MMGKIMGMNDFGAYSGFIMFDMVLCVGFDGYLFAMGFI